MNLNTYAHTLPSKSQNKNLKRAILVILLALLVALFYLFLMLPTGGGVVLNTPTDLGKMKFLFAIYGPGVGAHPTFKNPMAVTVDKDNNIYISDTGNNRITVFDKEGLFLYEFGERGVANPSPGMKATWKPGTFNFPYGLAIDPQTNNLYVADMLNKRIQIFDATGKYIDYFPKGAYGGTASDIIPTDIAIKNGKVYVCSPYQIVIFDTKGKFIKDFGMPGTKSGEFDRPNGIDVDNNGNIYVSDCNNLRVQAFTANGKFKWVYGQKVGMTTNKTKKRMFGLPRALAVGTDGNIYIADAFHFNIKVLSPQGKLLAAMGQRGVEAGKFNFPNGLEISRNSNIYVADKNNDRVQVLKFTGLEIEKGN